MSQIIKPIVKSKECRFVTYVKPNHYDSPDVHFIKEIIHYEDGTSKANLLAIYNFKRKFWVTKKGCRDHQQKKEWEDIDKLEEYICTQSMLVYKAARALDQSGFMGNLRMLSTSPYLYGSDILSTSIIKQTYMDKYPMIPTHYSVAVLDSETDVIFGTEDIIIMSVTFKTRAIVVVRADFVEGYVNVVDRIKELANVYIGEYLTKRGVQLEVVIVDTSIDIIRKCFQRVHEWMPDFLAIWNINFDVKKIIRACEQAGVDPKTIFSDPSVPDEYQSFKYIEGPSQKVTASGKITPIKPAAQWHTVQAPASFYVIDAMCVFKHNRIGEPDKPSYSLDNILNTVLGIRKLKFKEAEKYKSLKLHQVMQTKHKLEYVVYNIFDCISIEELDEKTNDLSVVLPLFSGCSDFSKYNSQPRRTADELHYFCLANGKVMGTTGKETATDMDDETVDLSGWITALPAELVVDNGLCLIEENDELKTNIRIATADLDVSAAYPNNQVVMNVSKETTSKEITDIKNISAHDQKIHGINLSGGHTNAIEFCTGMLGFPQLRELLIEFENEERTVDVEISTRV